MWFFRSGHPQHLTHHVRQYLRTQLPLIAGKYLPKPPRDPPELDNPPWVRQADTWATFVLVYLAPWDLERHTPNWPLSWHGLEGWRASLDLSRALHRGRWQLARNLATAAFNDHTAKNIAFRYRRRTAHTYAQYQAMRNDPVMRQQMDAAEARGVQLGVDPPHSLPEDGPVGESAQRIIDILQDRFARYIDGDVPRHVALQRQRDEQTVQNLARLLAPGVSPGNAFDDLSGLSSLSEERDLARDHHLRREPEDRQLPLNLDLLPGLVRTASLEAMQAVYKEVRRARPITVDDVALEAPSLDPADRPSRLNEPDVVPLCGPLSSDQQMAFDKIMAKFSSGEQLLEIVHGMPGTGKSVTASSFISIRVLVIDLQVLASRLREALGHDAVLVVAPSGKAAALHPGGMTVQAAFRLGRMIHELLALTSTAARDAQHELHDRRLIVFMDEYSMCEAHVFALTHLRLVQLYPARAHLPFAGRHMIVFGDPFQLAPVGTSLFDTACNDALQDPLLRHARALIRMFTQHILHTVLRTRDPFWVALLRRFCDPVQYPQPITREMLQPACAHCTVDLQRIADPDDHEPNEETCPPICPHRCQHFKELNEADVASYPEWQSCKFIAPHNSTVDRFSLVRLRSIARDRGQVVIRWRLPLTATEDRALPIVNEAEAEEMPQLFGYFVKEVPIQLTQNANTRIQFAHGSSALLHSLALADPSELIALLESGHYSSGDVLTLTEPPNGVFVQPVGLRPEARQALLSVHAPVDDNGDPLLSLPTKLSPAFTRKLEFGRDQHGALTLHAHDPGYEIDVAGSIHSSQGDTIQFLTAEFNAPVAMKAFSLSSVYVAISRVPAGCRFRVAPWNHAVGKQHLLNMVHSSSILRYLASFNERTGAFEARLLQSALEVYPMSTRHPIAQPATAIRRPRRTLPTVPAVRVQERPRAQRRSAAEAQLDPGEARRVRQRVRRGEAGAAGPRPSSYTPDLEEPPPPIPHGPLRRVARQNVQHRTISWANNACLHRLLEVEESEEDPLAILLLEHGWPRTMPGLADTMREIRATWTNLGWLALPFYERLRDQCQAYIPSSLQDALFGEYIRRRNTCHIPAQTLAILLRLRADLRRLPQLAQYLMTLTSRITMSIRRLRLIM